MISGRDCISVIMMGVRSSKFSPVILSVDALAAPTAEIFSTINLRVDKGGQSNGRQSDHFEQPQLVIWLFLYKNWRQTNPFLNSEVWQGKEVAYFSLKTQSIVKDHVRLKSA